MQKLISIASISLSLLLSTARAQTLAKAKVEEPVLQELMGGCSLKCAFAWGVEVQIPGARSAAVKVLNDDNAESAWIAPEGKSGIGVKFKFVFPKKLPSELQGTPFYGLDLINGVWKSEEQWKAHGRVKTARLYYNDKPFLDVVFADSRRWQRLAFPDILVHAGDWMTFEILEVYPGANNSGAAITEIVLQGAH
jgi:hypothetical protein